MWYFSINIFYESVVTLSHIIKLVNAFYSVNGNGELPSLKLGTTYERPIFTFCSSVHLKWYLVLATRWQCLRETIPQFKKNSLFSHLMASLHWFQEFLTHLSWFLLCYFFASLSFWGSSLSHRFQLAIPVMSKIS